MFELTKKLLQEGTDCISDQLCAGRDEQEELEAFNSEALKELREVEEAFIDALTVFVDTDWYRKYNYLEESSKPRISAGENE